MGTYLREEKQVEVNIIARGQYLGTSEVGEIGNLAWEKKGKLDTRNWDEENLEDTLRGCAEDECLKKSGIRTWATGGLEGERDQRLGKGRVVGMGCYGIRD